MAKEKKKNWIKIEIWTATGEKIKLEGTSCEETNLAIIDVLSKTSESEKESS